MEQPCYKCGQAVEQGIPFCPHCGAPQIRVVVAPPVPAIASSPSAAPVSDSSSGAVIASDAVAVPVRGAHLLKPCALAALVASILVVLGLYLPVAMIAAGALAVVFYRQQIGGLEIKPAAGFRIGALGGLFFSLDIGLISGLAYVLQGPKVHQAILESAEKWVASLPPDPNVQAALEQLKTPSGFALDLALGCVLLFVVCLITASLGGGLVAAILGRGQKR
jgi:hypothetical protein